MIGKLFNQRYQIIEKLGSGGTAIVYKGQDTLLGRMVTVKILREEYASNEDFVRRFRREAQAVASLSHGNIVAVYDVGFEEGMHYIVMEFVEGFSLKEYIKNKGALEVQEACRVMIQILDGIGYAHEHGIIHRDIKPHNILLGHDGRAKVTDFGIAVGMSDVTQTYNTSSRIMGSVHYIAPEQVQGQTVTEKSDLYSAGVVFYEMLTGELPFNGDTPISIAMQHVQGELILPHQLNPRIPIGLSYVVMRAMRKNPETRYDTAKEMAEAIRSVSEGLTSIYEPPEDNLEGTRELPVQMIPANQALEPASRNKLVRPRKKDSDLADQGRESRTPGRKFRIPIGLIVILVLVAVLVAAVIWAVGQLNNRLDPTDSKIEVPDVVGQTEMLAMMLLEAEGLEVNVQYRVNEDVQPGEVMLQSPAAGSLVGEGREILLTVSSGPELIEVPDLLGNTQGMAEVKLNNRGLAFNITDEKHSDDFPEGEVMEQEPIAGTMVNSGTMVALVMSLGPEPQPTDVPNVVSMTLSEAQAALQTAGLEAVVEMQESVLYESGIVFGQSVAAGTTVDEGTEITLTVSDGPGPPINVTPSVNYYRVTATVANDGANHRVTIVVNDQSGEHTELDNYYPPGTSIDEMIPHYGAGAIYVFVDERMNNSYVVTDGGV